MLKLCKGLSPGKPISIGGFNVSPSKNPLKLNIPLNGSIIPLKGMQAVPSFNRNTTATIVDHEGIIHTALINEIRFPGDRRVRNLLSNTEVLSTQTVTVLSGSSYILSFSGTGSVTLSGAATGTLTGTTGRVQFIKAASTTSLTLTVSGAVLQAQLERLTGTQTQASEYVSTGELSWPYHGAGVDGVKYFMTDRAGNALSVSGVLIEPSSTNLIPFSDNFIDNWVAAGVDRTASAIDSPLGKLHGTMLRCTATGQCILYIQTGVCVPTVSGSTYTQSILAKAGTTNFVSMTFNSVTFSNLGHAVFDLANGIVNLQSNCTARIKEVGDGWFRCSITNTASTSGTQSYVIITPSRSGAARAQGVSGDSVYIDASQTEVGSPTSYIPTSGTTVTRTADVLSYNIGDVITQGQGSWYCEFKYSYSSGDPRIFELTDNTSSNTIIARVTNTKYLGVLVTTGGVSQAAITTSTPISDNTLYKVLLTYKNNSIKLYLNGVLVGEDLSCTVPNLLKLFAGGTGAGSGQLNGYINNFKYFREVLSGAESIRRTS